MTTDPEGTRRRIIPRPRLTTLLDESPARIKLLVAPAGYGKTTLAQEWLQVPKRQDVWYRGGPAAADVAALAAGIAVAVSEVIADAGKRMRARLRATGHPDEDVEILGELFAEDIEAWPEEAWLAIDDYQFAMESSASERFVDLLTQQTSIQLLITSRRRPSWATARRILYGEIQEIDRRTLVMEDDEARSLLGRNDQSVENLLDRAQGWPAVLGLAALTHGTEIPSSGVPHALYQYFAEEVFQEVDGHMQLDLARLALAQVVDEHLALTILGDRSAQTLSEGTRLGVLVRDRDGSYLVHPLLREFLDMQLELHAGSAREASFVYVGECLLLHERWDEAFDLAGRFDNVELAERVLESALDRLLQEGRIATITRWLERRSVVHAKSAIFDLAEAEASFRLGEHEKAEALAAQAATRLPDEHPFRSRAYARAGRSAGIASREQEGFEYFRLARQYARNAADLREALVGLFFAASELGLPQAATYLVELADLDDDSPEAALRVGVARLTAAMRDGAIGEAVARERRVRYVAGGASDPLAATSFLHMLANGLNLLGQYDEAYGVIAEILEITRKYRLDMPVPHALLNRALTQHGRREFKAAHASLDQVVKYLPPAGDTYLEFNARAIRGRLLVSEGRFEDALLAVERPADRISSPVLRSEYLGTQALVYACLGNKQRPSELLTEAMAAFSRSVESRVLGTCAVAIADGEASTRFARSARRAWESAAYTGNLDGIVCAYRGYPPLLRALLGHEDARPTIADLLARARDVRIARRMGFALHPSGPPTTGLLTPREAEVYELLRGGLSNRAIAQTLFVSEATVKVHLRHVYEKLGVRTRSEALAQSLRP